MRADCVRSSWRPTTISRADTLPRSQKVRPRHRERKKKASWHEILYLCRGRLWSWVIQIPDGGIQSIDLWKVIGWSIVLDRWSHMRGLYIDRGRNGTSLPNGWSTTSFSRPMCAGWFKCLDCTTSTKHPTLLKASMTSFAVSATTAVRIKQDVDRIP